MHRELGNRAGRRRLAFGPRQLRANQRSPERPIVGRVGGAGVVGECGGDARDRRRARLRGAPAGASASGRRRLFGPEPAPARRPGRRLMLSSTWVNRAAVVPFFRGAGTRAFLNSCSASHTTQRVRWISLVDHRDNGVVGDAALARTIIVQHVARPILAFLHATPPKSRFLVPGSCESILVGQLTAQASRGVPLNSLESSVRPAELPSDCTRFHRIASCRTDHSSD